MAVGSTRAVTRWTSRIIPVVLAACAGIATYVVTDRICVQYLLRSQGNSATAIAVLVLHFVFFTLMAITYIRTLVVVSTNPGVVPLPAQVEESRRRTAQGQPDVESQWWAPEAHLNPDSPGLEQFYSKDIFVCANDGRPIWCSSCGNWKPDRAHHSSEINRCVRKMDHYCPWVGGMVSETSFKYFVQFTFYAALYCAVVLAISAYVVHSQMQGNLYMDGWVIGVIAMSGFFGLFTFSMTATSFRFIFINLTNVDVIRHSTRVYQLAVRVPRGTTASDEYGVITFPLAKPGFPSNGHAPGESTESNPSTADRAMSARDQMATRSFAVVKTEMGENPWNLGFYQNWVSVMGTDILDWLFPIRPSPCCDEENNESFYRMGPVYRAVRQRYKLPDLPPGEQGIELRELGKTGT